MYDSCTCPAAENMNQAPDIFSGPPVRPLLPPPPQTAGEQGTTSSAQLLNQVLTFQVGEEDHGVVALQPLQYLLEGQVQEFVVLHL